MCGHDDRMSAALKPTVDDYLATEADSPVKREFVGGDIYAMGGARPRHNVVTTRLTSLVDTALQGRPCMTFSADQRVTVDATGGYFYPDLTVTCEPPRFVLPAPDALTNPTVLFEVLSPSTASWDRGGKFAHYQRCPSLQAYVLVDPDLRRLECYTRAAPPASGWHYHSADGDTPLSVDTLGLTLVPTTLFAVLDALPPESEGG